MHPEQEELPFAVETSPPAARGRELTLHASPERPLSKAEKRFNQLIKQVEQLQAEILRRRKAYAADLEVFQTEIAPRLARLQCEEKKLAEALIVALRDPKMKLTARRTLWLKRLIVEHLQSAGDTAESSPELAALLDELERTRGHEDADDAEFDIEKMAREAAEQIFKQKFGVDVDLDAYEYEMTPEQRAAEDERIRQAVEGAEANRPPPKMTAKQREKAERELQREELKKKGINTIYRQLAKVLHPDLERDPEQKATKQALMQELTQAYEANDLHKMLRLELTFIQREHDRALPNRNATLEIYNDVLREQVQELRATASDLVFDPAYAPLQQLNLWVMRRADWRVETVRMIESDIHLLRRRQEALASPDRRTTLIELITERQKRPSFPFGF